MNKKERAFVKTVLDYYTENGRSELPWRKTIDPYHIHVSEVMLQQTQVPRVIEKYTAFLKEFPTVHELRNASLGPVLRLWQGLGYNRRAKLLHQSAGYICNNINGVYPRTYEELLRLPGVGPYTANAILTFAYNMPVVMIETNIRSAFLHHFFYKQKNVTDADISPLILKTLDAKEPRMWYSALMDYGTYIKSHYGNPNSKSKHYTKQSGFKGSDREIRGVLLRVATQRSFTLRSITRELGMFDQERIKTQLMALVQEGMLLQSGAVFQLP